MYKIYRTVKNSLKGEFLKNKFLYLFGNRYFIHLVIIIIATLVATSNIKAYDKKSSLVKFEKDSIVGSLVRSGEFDEGEGLIEENINIEKIRSQKREAYYLPETKNSLSYQPQLNIPNEEFSSGLIAKESGLINGGGLLKTEKIPEKRTEIVKYTVKDGDTVSSIAKRFNITSNTIIWENALNSYGFIKPGQELVVLPVTGVSYNVKKYDTIGKIANKYGVSESEIMEANKIASATSLQISQKLIIPGANKISVTPVSAPVKKVAEVARYTPAAQNSAETVSNIKSLTNLLWPATCSTITQYFYWGHSGLDIACKLGTPLYAAEDGVVKNAGWLSGYGKMVIIKHGSGMETLYGHMNKIDVQVGQAVNRGDILGEMGSTGWSTGSHIHFEVRIGGAKKNPLSYL